MYEGWRDTARSTEAKADEKARRGWGTGYEEQGSCEGDA